MYGFLNRIRFRYTFGDRFDYCFSCLCCRNLSEDKRSYDVKKHYLFEKARRKLESELDIVKLVKSLRKLKTLTHAFLP